ncbi:MAG: acetate--CoA ligase family protein [Candidatus Hadarchaeum sp.]|uniref:acetate--CoA ligase family protein n=1 Tax=Candidatus Hadarchaeum sp. TaxID=2883567 RepID=UPI0031748D4F
MTSKQKILEILNSAKTENRRELSEMESKSLLEAWGIPVNRTALARDVDEAVRIGREIRYPLVLKIASPDIIHKSDAKGVMVGISSELELKQAFNEIIKNAREYKPGARILGVTIQEYLPPAREVIVGAIQDPSFGATVMFGLGGIWVEVLKDISFRLAPLTIEEAKEMIKEIKGYPVLAGIRGTPPADIEALASLIQKVGQLAYEFPEIAEMDLNPVFVFNEGKGAVAVDARIVLGEGK